MYKKKLNRLLSVLLMLVLLLSSIPANVLAGSGNPPAVSAQPQSLAVTGGESAAFGVLSAGTTSSGIYIHYYDAQQIWLLTPNKQKVTVESGYAASLGYSTPGLIANKDKVTVFDALVKKVRLSMDEAGTLNYLQINNEGVITMFLLDKTYYPDRAFCFMVNGEKLMTNPDVTILSDGDELEIIDYNTTSIPSYTWFEQNGEKVKDTIVINNNTNFSLTLRGKDLVTTSSALAGVAISKAPIIGDCIGTFTQIDNKTTGEDGSVTLSFDTPGHYILSTGNSTSDGKTTLVPSQCYVVVKDNASAQMTNLQTKLNYTSDDNQYSNSYAFTKMYEGSDAFYYGGAYIEGTNASEAYFTGWVNPGASVTINSNSVTVSGTGAFAYRIDEYTNDNCYKYYPINVRSANGETNKTYYALVLFGQSYNDSANWPKVTELLSASGDLLTPGAYKEYQSQPGYMGEGYMTGYEVGYNQTSVCAGGTLKFATSAMTVKKINASDGTVTICDDAVNMGGDGLSFKTNALPIDPGHNYFLFEQKLASSNNFIAYGILHIYRQETYKSNDAAFNPLVDLEIKDVNGNKLTPVWDAANSHWQLTLLQGGEAQNQVTFKLLSKPEGATVYGFSDVDATFEFPLPTYNIELLTKDYSAQTCFSVTSEDEINITNHNFQVTRPAMTPKSVDDAASLYQIIPYLRMTTGEYIYNNVYAINPDGTKVEPPLENMPILDGNSSTSFLITPKDDVDNQRIARFDFTAIAKYGSLTYKVDGVPTAGNSNGYLSDIIHTGASTYGAGNKNCTKIEVTVTPPEGSGFTQTKTYAFIIPKPPTTAVDIVGVTVRKARENDSIGRDLYTHGTTTKTNFSAAVSDYDVKLDYNTEYVYIVPTLVVPEIEGNWTLNGQPVTPVASVLKGGVDGIIPVNVGKNTIGLTLKVKGDVSGTTAKTYTFHITRETNCNADFTFSNNVDIVGNKDLERRSDISLGYDQGQTTYNLTASAKVSDRTVTISQNNSTKATGTSSAAADGLSLGSAVTVTVSDAAAGTSLSYTIKPYAHATNAPSKTYALMPAPGQFLNGDWSGFDSVRIAGNIGLPDSGNVGGSGGGSLGAFGGYVIYQYNDPIKNGPINKYGADFTILGNAFAGNNEPAGVKVAQDKNGDGKPDEWYDLAGSMHYDDGTLWDYKVTYKNPNPDFMPYMAEDIPYTDNYGKSGVTPRANSYHTQIYYPDERNYAYAGNNAPYNNTQMTYSGVRLDAENCGGRGIPVHFGYADTCQSSNTTAVVDKNPYRESQSNFDIDWAVDKEGNPVHLDEISFVWIYNATLYDKDATGELSPEIMGIARTDKDNSTVVGRTSAPTSIVLKSSGSKDLVIDGSQLPLELDVGDRKFIRTVINGQEGDSMFVNNERVTSGSETAPSLSVNKNSNRLIRVIVQSGEKEAYIALLRLTGNAQATDTLLTGLHVERNGANVAISHDETFKYTANVPYTYSEVQIVPTVKKGTVVKINGQELGSSGKSAPISLAAGATTTIVIEATSKGGVLEKTTLEITRAAYTGDNSEITVTFKLLGTRIHDGKGPLLIYKNNPEKFDIWIPGKTFTLPAGSTVGDVFSKALNEAGLGFKNSSGNYVASIQSPSGEWLAEFSNGKNSGWMYTVNGKHPNVGLAYCILKNGDDVVWHYTDDYRFEEGSEKWNDETPPTDTGNTAASGAAAEVDIARVVNGRATSTIVGDTLSGLLKKAKETAGDGKAVAAFMVKVPDGAKALDIVLSKEAVAALAQAKDTALKISSRLSEMTFDPVAAAALAKEANSKGAELIITVATVPVEGLSAEVKKVVGNRPVYDFSVSIGNTAVSTFGGGSLRIGIPYTPASGEDKNSIVVYYINDRGELEVVKNCRYDEKTGCVYFTTNHLSCYAVGYNKKSFTDITGKWMQQAVEYMAARGVVEGVGGNQFAPDEKTTRAQFVTLLMRALEPAANTEKVEQFSDVAAGKHYYDSVLKARALGLVDGMDGNRFNPDEAISREQMFTITYRALKKLELLGGYNKMDNKVVFSDKAAITDYAAEAVDALAGYGLVNGSYGKLNPKGLASRAECARFFYIILTGMK